jgi:hypothetical protein
MYFIGLKGSKDIFRKSQEVSAPTLDHTGVYGEIFQKRGTDKQAGAPFELLPSIQNRKYDKDNDLVFKQPLNNYLFSISTKDIFLDHKSIYDTFIFNELCMQKC